MKSFLTGFIITAVVFASNDCFADGDPFYYSTWYAQPSPVLSWSSASVMQFGRPGLLMNSIDGLSRTSPRFYTPGYGYIGVAPNSMLHRGAYEPTWSYGVIQPAHVSRGIFGPSDRIGPTVLPGTLHQPWYLPGSPGNSMSPLATPSRW